MNEFLVLLYALFDSPFGSLIGFCLLFITTLIIVRSIKANKERAAKPVPKDGDMLPSFRVQQTHIPYVPPRPPVIDNEHAYPPMAPAPLPVQVPNVSQNKPAPVAPTQPSVQLQTMAPSLAPTKVTMPTTAGSLGTVSTMRATAPSHWDVPSDPVPAAPSQVAQPTQNKAVPTVVAPVSVPIARTASGQLPTPVQHLPPAVYGVIFAEILGKPKALRK